MIMDKVLYYIALMLRFYCGFILMLLNFEGNDCCSHLMYLGPVYYLFFRLTYLVSCAKVNAQ